MKRGWWTLSLLLRQRYTLTRLWFILSNRHSKNDRNKSVNHLCLLYYRRAVKSALRWQILGQLIYCAGNLPTRTIHFKRSLLLTWKREVILIWNNRCYEKLLRISQNCRDLAPIPPARLQTGQCFVVPAENLAPSELKKLRNKQRKARRKAEQESAQAREAQVKRDHHHKSRQQGDVEADAPQLDELIPDKLARVRIWV